MTIGERIRYYRKNADMTQRELAATTGIHYVSICNYESGKMIPREDQIRKIADALGISYSSLNNPDSDTRRFQTLGNLFELLMSLHRSGVMTLSGKRDTSGAITKKSAKLTPMNNLFAYFRLLYPDTNDSIDLSKITLQIQNDFVLSKMIEWEALYYAISSLEGKEKLSRKEKDCLAKAKTDIGLLEIELTGYRISLDSSKGINILED